MRHKTPNTNDSSNRFGALPFVSPVNDIRAWELFAQASPTPYTPHPSSCALHLTPYTLHPSPCTPRPTPCTLHPSHYTLRPKTLHPTSGSIPPEILNPGARHTSQDPVQVKDFVVKALSRTHTLSLFLSFSCSRSRALSLFGSNS